jgi:predicted small lipoprotein YifL
MKLKFPYFLSIAMLALVAETYAQEGSQGPDELPPAIEAATREDKPLLYEPDGKASTNQQPIIIPNTPSKPKAKTTDSGKGVAKAEEDDALSFNFLLHIIQKFKSSDVIDQ